MKTKTYKNKDFYTSSVLLASKKYKLLRLEKINNKLVEFVFSDPRDTAKEIIEKHWNGTNIVSSKDLIEAICELKTRIYTII